MNTFKFLKPLIFTACLILSISCDNDASIDQELVSLETELQQKNRHSSYEVLLVQYRNGLSEQEKQRIRDRYINLNFLVFWEICDEDRYPDFETWSVMPQKDTDIPIDPEEEDDDVERFVQGATCRSL